ncbi:MULTISPECIES: TonB-dependent siderophore receptor [unclassified Duganella]|uniref:TonB-dependent receptor n=1 Tax=unclassified Duganella TaxID=2636909 RepID=UPI00088B30AC|nr:MULTISPECIES: TonB-dependent siderophore receptor [unclassified Duganella]SDG82536.1 iron complex outermembrane recepter protein [Duganella sp. OV458]SDK09950.1 iron complex outermembrane recepter protein [Duganella sp. OV510]
MPTFDLKLSPLAFAAMLTAAASAQAQTDAAPADDKVQSVVINASADASANGLSRNFAGGQVARGGRAGLLGNVDIMDAPFNSLNFTADLIQEQQARSVADVLQNDPSVRVARGFGNFQELYVIRGFAVSSDDLAYNGLYGVLPRQFVASELLERVEVFRGANSFLNGAAPGGGGIGGSINLLPKRAGNAPLTQVTVGVETGGQGYAAADIGRRFGEENRAGIRVNVARRDGDTGVDKEHRELSVASVGLDYQGRGFRLSADLGYQDHKLTAPRPAVTPSGTIPLPAVPDSTSNWAQDWTHSNERDTFGTLRGEWDINKDTVAWAAFGARSGDENNVLSEPTVTAADGTANAYRFDNTRHDNVRTGEIGVRTKLRTGSVGHTISASASSYWLESKNAYAFSTFGGIATNIYKPVDVAAPPATFFTGGVLSNPGVTAKTIFSSYALADTMSMLDDKVLLTVGARHQSIKSEGYNYDTGASNAHYDETKVTPMAGIVYRPVKAVSLYANYIEGLQQGPTASGAEIDNTGEIFAPYVARQKEIGVKYEVGTLGATAALFRTNQPAAYVENGHFGVFGEQRNQGLELTVYGMPVRGLRLLGGLTLLDATQREVQDARNNGKDVIGVPDTQLNLGADWDVPGMHGLSINARTVYTSSQYADAANTQKLSSWTRLDLGASYATRILDRDVTFRARVDNVTDKSYWASAGGYPNSNYLIMGAPRTVSVSATVGF